ncbi:M81 family metallopeptidase [Oceanirhabdus seepicola]|uniref:M81 family metallopeptidase n=1 Tax=Oceanirhabdus seepicola TaxID=2828781 RepID=A0A9J6NYS1_9CLOT|nr:M81 family metallopeptidase [Oceanirhabdus seepicola]MCM1989419.1 M81 family metallopeptidase [Oceanirhabdus seepicola]
MKKLRFALCGFWHETNTYATEAMGFTKMDKFYAVEGAPIVELLKGADSVPGGFIETCHRLDIEVVPGFYALAFPSSTIERETYETIKRNTLKAIEKILPLDVVMIELHGAAVVKGIDDPEGDLLEAIRGVVGNDVKIITTLDLHGKITDKIINNIDYINGALCYPHLDLKPRADEAVERIVDILNNKYTPFLAYEYIPIVFPMLTTEADTFARDIKNYAIEISKRDGVLDCTVLHGFPLSDTTLSGMRVMVTTDKNNKLAEKYAKELGLYIWENRSRIKENYKKFVSPEEAIEYVKREKNIDNAENEASDFNQQILKTSYGYLPNESNNKPILLADVADNPGCGASVDATFLLEEMIKANLEKSVFLGLLDREVVDLALKHGVGSTIEVSLGGKHGKWSGNSIKTKAYVKSISDGHITYRGLSKGQKLDIEPIVRLIIGNVEVVVIRKPIQGLDDNFATELGIQYSDYNVVALKSAVHFRLFFTDKVEKILLVDTPGLGSNDIELFPKENSKSNLYPVHSDSIYE